MVLPKVTKLMHRRVRLWPSPGQLSPEATTQRYGEGVQLGPDGILKARGLGLCFDTLGSHQKCLSFEMTP